jgi:hypothetical protein
MHRSRISIRSLRLLVTLNENSQEVLIRTWKCIHFLLNCSVAPVLLAELEDSAPLMRKLANRLTSDLTKVHIDFILLSPTLPPSQPLLQRFRQQNVRKFLFPDALHLHPITTFWSSLYLLCKVQILSYVTCRLSPVSLSLWVLCVFFTIFFSKHFNLCSSKILPWISTTR